MKDELWAAIEERKAVIIVGTGVSIAATEGAPTASWEGLLKNGVEECVRLGKGDLAWAKRMKPQLESGDLDETLAAASQVESKIKKSGPGDWSGWLRKSVGSLKAADDSLLEAILDLRCPLATTNYDDLLEEAANLSAVTWTQKHKIGRVLRDRAEGILHLHGHWDDPDSVVLGLSTYEAVAGDETAKNLLQSLMSTRHFVFIGCGAGLGDPNWSRFRRWSREALKWDEGRHYLLCLEEEVDKLKQEHRGERIFPVPYGKEHEDLVGFLLSKPSRRDRSKVFTTLAKHVDGLLEKDDAAREAVLKEFALEGEEWNLDTAEDIVSQCSKRNLADLAETLDSRRHDLAELESQEVLRDFAFAVLPAAVDGVREKGFRERIENTPEKLRLPSTTHAHAVMAAHEGKPMVIEFNFSDDDLKYEYLESLQEPRTRYGLMTPAQGGKDAARVALDEITRTLSMRFFEDQLAVSERVRGRLARIKKHHKRQYYITVDYKWDNYEAFAHLARQQYGSLLPILPIIEDWKERDRLVEALLNMEFQIQRRKSQE